jgi:hypothetical protein
MTDRHHLLLSDLKRVPPCIVRTRTALIRAMKEGTEAARRRVVVALNPDACKMVQMSTRTIASIASKAVVSDS